MSKQKLVKIIIVLSLVIGIMIGGTSAFFVASDRTHNIITTSGVAVEIIETTDAVDDNGEPVPFQNIANAVPGETYSKIPTVKNIDDGSAWLRIHIVRTADLTNGNTVAVDDDVLELDINTQYWLTNGDGYYYYYRALDSGQITEPLFTVVTIKDNLQNEYNGATFNLKLVAQAVQTANNGDDVYAAEGWPEE